MEQKSKLNTPLNNILPKSTQETHLELFKIKSFKTLMYYVERSLFIDHQFKIYYFKEVKIQRFTLKKKEHIVKYTDLQYALSQFNK